METQVEDSRNGAEVIELLEKKLLGLEIDVVEVKELVRKMKAHDDSIPIMMKDSSVRYFPSPKPLSAQAAEDFKKAAELALELRKLPKAERIQFYEESMEKSRLEAIKRGIALENEEEAAIGD